MLRLLVGTQQLDFAVGHNCVMPDSPDGRPPSRVLRIAIAGRSPGTPTTDYVMGTETVANDNLVNAFANTRFSGDNKVRSMYEAWKCDSVISLFQRSSTSDLRQAGDVVVSKEDFRFHGYYRVECLQYRPQSDPIVQRHFVGNGLGEYSTQPAAQRNTTFLTRAQYEVLLVPAFAGHD